MYSKCNQVTTKCVHNTDALLTFASMFLSFRDNSCPFLTLIRFLSNSFRANLEDRYKNM